MVLVNSVCAQEKQSFREWAQTPPMGWNSWDCYGPTVTEKETKANADFMAENLKQQAHKLAAQKAEAEKKAAALEGVVLVISAKVSATGVTYGSVNKNTVADELQKKGFEIDRKIITMRDIKAVGEYEATIHFHKEVEVKVPVHVVAEGEEAKPEVKEEVAEAPVAEAPAAE